MWPTTSNIAVKVAPSGRWTLRDKAPRSAPYLKRWAAFQVARKMHPIWLTFAVFIGGISAFATAAEVPEPPRLKQTGERLIADLPRPSPTAAELARPCVNDRSIISNDPKVLETLGRRRVYLLAFESWGMKWMPSHASLRRPAQGGGCNDYRFLVRQFQRAYGQPELPGWTVQDVERLVKAVEPVAQLLVSDNALPPEILEPIPGFSDGPAFPVKEPQ